MDAVSAVDLNKFVKDAPVAAVGIPPGDDGRWASILRLIAAEYPYCTMHGVHVLDGCIVACEGVQRSFLFASSDAVAASTDPPFDAHWLALQSLCRKLGAGRLAELRFSRGRPVSARMNEGGRRFRRLSIKVSDKNRAPMS